MQILNAAFAEDTAKISRGIEDKTIIPHTASIREWTKTLWGELRKFILFSSDPYIFGNVWKTFKPFTLRNSRDLDFCLPRILIYIINLKDFDSSWEIKNTFSYKVNVAGIYFETQCPILHFAGKYLATLPVNWLQKQTMWTSLRPPYFFFRYRNWKKRHMTLM